MVIKNNYVVEKRNVLNELRANSMTIQELRFFCIYLSRINSRDIDTRVVRFPLDDFRKIMDLNRLKIEYLKNVTNNLLSKIINIPLEKKGNYVAFQIFKKCTVIQDENNEWYVEIDAHDDALPLMFEFKEKYFSYHLWNVLTLKSTNQLRMYEILKQYERPGERVLAVNELKELLGISKDEYARWDNFKRDVLEVCKKALAENTDIKFEYEPTGRRGKGNKILNLKFKIYKNENHSDPLTLEKFIGGKQNNENSEILRSHKESFDYLKEACEEEFPDLEFQVIYDLVIKIVPHLSSYQYGVDVERYNYIRRKYDELNLRASRNKINNRFSYFKKLIELDLE